MENTIKLAFAIALACAPSAIALSILAPNYAIANITVTSTPPPSRGPRTGTPGGPQGGGPRPLSKCPSVNTSVIAFMPAEGNTTQESPTFWFYVPYSAEQVDSFRFALRDETDRVIQPPKNIKLSGTPGFISLRLPPTSKPLEIGKEYRWSFSILCDPENRQDRIIREGVVRRISPPFSITNQTERRSLIEQYQNNGLWPDAFNLLAEQRRQEPNSPTVVADWNQMMEWLNLSNIAAPPIVSCCSLE